MDDKGTRDAYHQAIQERNALVHRTQKKRGGESDSDDSMDQDGVSSESGQDVDEAKRKDKSNALKRIQAEIGSSESDAESVDESGESEMSEENEENGKSFKMDFGDKNQANSKSSKGKKTGIMGLKFMERAQAKEKEALKAQAKLVMKQIKGTDDYDSHSEEENQQQNKETHFVSGSSKFGVKQI